MRVITLRQPWGYLIAYAGKDIENRTHNIAGSYRGPLAIHQGKGVDEDALRVFGDMAGLVLKDYLTATGIMAVTTLDDCHAPHPDVKRCGFWAQPGCWHLKLGDTRPLERPIPARGALGLWRPDDVLGRRLAMELAR